MQFSFDKNLIDIAFKVEDSERLTYDGGLSLGKLSGRNVMNIESLI